MAGHHHHHGHHHGHGQALDFGRAFAIGTALNFGFSLFEAGWGFFADSLSLVADAGHNMSDVVGLALAWGASHLARRQPSPRRSYGLRRTTILAALANSILLLLAVGAIALEAFQRLHQPAPVTGAAMMWVASAGIVINLATAFLFRRGREHDLNVRGAFLHMMADAAVSLAVVLGGWGIVATGHLWIDPVLSLAVAAVILVSTWQVLRDSIDLMLDAVPPGIDAEEVKRYLEGLPGVAEVHDLHIWAMSTTEVALTAHLVRPGVPQGDEIYHRATRELHERFGIEHATLQVECGDQESPCNQALEGAI